MTIDPLAHYRGDLLLTPWAGTIASGKVDQEKESVTEDPDFRRVCTFGQVPLHLKLILVWGNGGVVVRTNENHPDSPRDDRQIKRGSLRDEIIGGDMDTRLSSGGR